VIKRQAWPTTEHYFQAAKFDPLYPDVRETVRNLPTARQAFEFVRRPENAGLVRKDWRQIKDAVMLKALRAKFSQIERLSKLLVDTGERPLVEHTASDSYWGDGGDGTGQNRLGTLLQQVRQELRDSAPPPPQQVVDRDSMEHQ
jgi:N-glycosidase YbiA